MCMCVCVSVCVCVYVLWLAVQNHLNNSPLSSFHTHLRGNATKCTLLVLSVDKNHMQF